MNILGICHVYTRYFCDEVLKENCAFLTISGFNITLSLSMAMVYSIELHINTWKWNFDIHSIYMVYTMYIQPLGIYMVYTWYIPTIYLIGVPDVINLHIWHIGIAYSANSAYCKLIQNYILVIFCIFCILCIFCTCFEQRGSKHILHNLIFLILCVALEGV